MYIAAMLHMTNIRELEFVNSFVGVEHWDAIATLESLEELTLYGCNFLHWQGPADVGPKKRIKVPHLRVNGCPKLRPPIAAIDPRYLRTLAVDNKFFDHVDWLSPSALTELYITILPWQTIDVTLDHMQRLHTILVQAHQSLEKVTVFFDEPLGLEDVVRGMFDNPVWKNMPLLCSLTLIARFEYDEIINYKVRQLSSSSVSHGS